jgi:Indole-3-glycerol phosphate synthase
VNNRNLRTLEVDVNASERLIARMPAEVVAISESGLKSADDITRLREAGYRAFLIGERFMAAADPGAELARLLASCGSTEDTEGTEDAEAQRAAGAKIKDAAQLKVVEDQR